MRENLNIQELRTTSEEGFAETFLFQQNPLGGAQETLLMGGVVLGSPEDGQWILHSLANFIRREYFQGSEDPEKRFKRALRKAEEYLYGLRQSQKVSWPAPINFFAAAVFNGSDIHLSIAGLSRALLKRQEKYFDLGKRENEQSADSPNALAVFHSILEGALKPGDHLLLAASAEDVSFPRGIFENKTAPTVLKSIATQTSRLFAGFLLVVAEREEESSRMPFLAAHPFGQALRALRSVPNSGNIFFAAGSLIVRAALALARSATLYAATKFGSVAARMLPKLSRNETKAAPRALQATLTAASRLSRIAVSLLVHGTMLARRLVQKRKRLAAGTLLAAIFIGFFAIRGSDFLREKSSQQSASELSAFAEELFIEVENAAIYRNEEKALAILADIEGIAKELHDAYREENAASLLSARVTTVRNTVLGRTPLAESTTLLEFSNFPVSFSPRAVAGIETEDRLKLYFSDEESGGVYRYEREASQGKFIFGELGGNGFSRAMALARNPAMLFFAGTDKLTAFDTQEERFVGGIALNGKQKITVLLGGASFDNNAYLLAITPEEKKVLLKYTLSEDGAISFAKSWLRESAAKRLEAAVDIASDGSIYALEKEGAIAVFTNGQFIKRLEPDYGQGSIHAVRFSLSPDGSLWYVLENAQGRFIEIDKTSGAVRRDFVHAELAGAKDFWIAPKRRELIVLTGEKVLSFTLPQEATPSSPEKTETKPE